MLVPGVGAESAVAVGERVRRAIEAAQPGGLSVTCSVGVSVASGGEIEFDPLFSAADRALYEAKRAGRNQVELTAERVAA